MPPDHPLVRDVHPDLIAELVTLLEEEGEPELAVSVRDIRPVSRCGCGDDFCQGFSTEVHPEGQPFDEGHRCVPLSPARGEVVLDVVGDRIMYVELLNRPPLRDRRES